MNNIVEKIYGPEYSPQTGSRMRYDIDMHVEAFLMDDRDNAKGYYHNANQEQISNANCSHTLRSELTEEGKTSKPGLDTPFKFFSAIP